MRWIPVTQDNGDTLWQGDLAVGGPAYAVSDGTHPNRCEPAPILVDVGAIRSGTVAIIASHGGRRLLASIPCRVNGDATAVPTAVAFLQRIAADHGFQPSAHVTVGGRRYPVDLTAPLPV